MRESLFQSPDEGDSSAGNKKKTLIVRLRPWFGILISFFFLWLIIRSINLDQLAEIYRGASPGPILPAIIVYFCGVLLRAVRWQILLKPVKAISFAASLRVISIGYMANNLLPFRAGEFYRAHLLGKEYAISKTSVLSTIVLERVFDGLAMLLFLSLTFFVLAPPVPVLIWTLGVLSAILFVGLTLFFFAVVLFPSLVSTLERIITSYFPASLASASTNLMHKALDGLDSLRGGWAFIGSLVLSTLAWSAEALMYYFLFSTLSLDQGYVAALVLVAVVNLGIMIPSSPGYVGTFEYFCTQTLHFFGVNATIAFSYAVFLHAALFFPITLVGLGYFWKTSLPFSAVSQPAELSAPSAEEADDER